MLHAAVRPADHGLTLRPGFRLGGLCVIFLAAAAGGLAGAAGAPAAGGSARGGSSHPYPGRVARGLPAATLQIHHIVRF